MPLQFSLPRRRKVTKSGIERAPKREWPRHRKFVRSHACCVPGCQREPIEFAHLRSAANSGTGIKPHDAFGISLCHAHHREQHLLGQPGFEKQYHIDLGALAAAFVKASPDQAMRDSLALVPQPGCVNPMRGRGTPISPNTKRLRHPRSQP